MAIIGTTAVTTAFVFIDGSIDNLEALCAGIDAGQQLVVLDPTRDGLSQIAGALQGFNDLAAIHIISHGAAGRLMLGSTSLDRAALSDHADRLAAIGSTLSAGGDLLLYGCDVAAGGVGQAFIELLADLTGADVAASTDRTGAAVFGGNWRLEAASGSIEAASLALYNFSGLLGTPTFVTASPFSGPAIVDPLSGTGQLIRPYLDTQNLAAVANGAAVAVVSGVLAGATTLHDAAGINDGYYGNASAWIPAATPGWLKIDLGLVSLISSLSFGRDRLGVNLDRPPGSYTISVATSENAYATGNSSNDSTEYTQVFDASFSGSTGALTLLNSFAPVNARYIKIEFSNSGVALDEVQVYEHLGNASLVGTPGKPTCAVTTTPSLDLTPPVWWVTVLA